MSNIYYHPEDYNLTVVAELEHSDQNYCFDTSMAWKSAEGKVYFAESSGCSCPSPFEEYSGLPDLKIIDRNELGWLRHQIMGHEYSEASKEEKEAFLKKVEEAVNG